MSNFVEKLNEKIKKIKERTFDKPWLKYYKGIPESLNYFEGSMIENVEQVAMKYPENSAYEYYDTECTYLMFVKKVIEVAKSLKMLGVKENDNVTICMPNTPQAVIMFYAINMVGAIANMVHPLSAEKEIEFYLNKAKSKIVLVIDIAYEKLMKVKNNTSVKKVIVASADEEMSPFNSFGYWLLKGRKIHIEFNCKSSIRWGEFVILGKNYNKEYRIHRNALDPAVILYSGGTTGKPKGIVLSNLAFNSIALQCEYMVGAKAGQSILSAMPIFHGFGLGICVHAPLAIGMKAILIPQLNTKKINSVVKKKKPNFLPGVPTMFELMTKEKRISINALKSVTCILSGGDFLNGDLKKKVESFFREHGSSAVVRIGYGLTECAASTCVSQIDNYKDGSIGIPFPDVSFKIVKPNTDFKVPYGEDGEICISGPSVMLGYLDDEFETLHTLKQHEDGKIWLHTGDIGSMDKDGMMYFKSRLKRIIISSGYNIYPSHIEEILNKHPKIFTSTVIGINHPYKVQVAKAYIVLKDKVEETSELKSEIKAYCKQYLAKYSVPAVFEFRKVLPKTLLGKVAYRDLD